jgi:hypothetical protein
VPRSSADRKEPLVHRAVLSAAISFLLCSCTVDVPEPAGGLFACDEDDDCSGDWYCDTTVRRCVDPDAPYGDPCDTLPCSVGESCVADDTRPDGYWCVPGTCGNEALDPGEECDGPEPAGVTCGTDERGIGALPCLRETCTWDASGCFVPPAGWYGPGVGEQATEVASNGGANSSDIAIDNAGRPVVAYMQLNAASVFVVRVSRFEGSDRYFEDLNSGEPLSNTSDGASRPRVAVAPDGRVGVVYRQLVRGAVDAEIHFRQYHGDGWGPVVGLGSCGTSVTCSRRPEIVYNVENGTFMVVWMTDQQLQAAQVTVEDGLVALPSPSADNTMDHDQPTIAANWETGEVTVAWRADDGSRTAIFVKRWDSGSNSWERVGWAATDGGVTGWGDHRWPSLARDGAGPLALAWQRSPVGGGQTEGALRIWDGSWAFLGDDDVAIDARPYIAFLNVAVAGAEPALVWQDGESIAGSAGNILASFWREGAWRRAPEPAAVAGDIDIDEWDQGAGLTRVATGSNGIGARQICATWSQKDQPSFSDFSRVMVRCRPFPP